MWRLHRLFFYCRLEQGVLNFLQSYARGNGQKRGRSHEGSNQKGEICWTQYATSRCELLLGDFLVLSRALFYVSVDAAPPRSCQLPVISPAGRKKRRADL